MSIVIVDQSQWGHIAVTGEDRVRFLQGMCTANIETLAQGDWIRAAMLNTKGRVTSVIEVVHRGEDLLVICEASLTEKTIALLDKHAIMDEVEFEAVELDVHRVWDSPAAVWDAPPVFAPLPGPASSPEDVESRRIEAGMPRYGVDVCEDHFPFESLLARHIDYEKGCYLGQEPISRVHFRGNAQKALRGLALSGDGPAAPGAVVSHPDRDKAGAVTSSALSPTFGPIALAYIHRTVFEPGNQVTVGERSATIVELPFST